MVPLVEGRSFDLKSGLDLRLSTGRGHNTLETLNYYIQTVLSGLFKFPFSLLCTCTCDSNLMKSLTCNNPNYTFDCSDCKEFDIDAEYDL